MSYINVRRSKHSTLNEVDFNNLEFGKYVSDHMLICEYDDTVPVSPGWKEPQIVPYANLSLNPATLALHYGQTVFEGMKAFRMADGSINIFRLERHYERFVRSLNRMCMAVPSFELFEKGLKKLVEVDKDWVPTKPGDALYLRPFVFASEARFGVKVSAQYKFVIFTGPVPELYASPIRVKVETDFVRAARGGTGYAKCGGNYGGAFYPTQLARGLGYDQVLWTDSRENKFIEESGSMNVMFVIDGKLVTPPLSDSILDGVTRDSLIAIANDLGIAVQERRVSVDELAAGFKNGQLTEAFGAGTAAVIAPIGLIHLEGMDYQLPEVTDHSVQMRLKKALQDLRLGLTKDRYNWNTVLPVSELAEMAE